MNVGDPLAEQREVAHRVRSLGEELVRARGRVWGLVSLALGEHGGRLVARSRRPRARLRAGSAAVRLARLVRVPASGRSREAAAAGKELG